MQASIYRIFIAVALCIAITLAPSLAWFPHGSASTIDTLLVPIIGDSNTGSGECFNATYDTLSSASVIQLKHNFTTAQAQEPLDLISMGTSCGSNVSGVSGDVGPTTKLIQLLQSNGKVPAGIVRIVIIPSGWAGTGLNVAGNAYWVPFGNTGCNSTNKCGCALDGAVNYACGIAAGTGLYGMISQARSLYPNSKIWFINAVEGANDGGMAAGAWQAAVTLLINDIRSKNPDAATVPILWSGIPPDRINSSLGYETNLANVITDQTNIGTYISHAYYINPSAAPVLHSYFDNGYVHFNSASQRGGVPNFITSGNNTDGTPHVWSSAATYNPAGAFLVQETVLASDGFIYTCISGPSTNNNPTTDGGVHWSKQWDTTATVAVTDSLAGRQYSQLVAAGF